MFKHLNTGAVAEVIESTDKSVTLRVAETDEVKEVALITFRRWWKPVETEGLAVEEPTEGLAVEEPETEELTPEEPRREAEEPTPEASRILSLSEIVGKLEGLFDTLNTLYFDGKLTKPVITVQSSPKSYGHCSTKKIWKESEDVSYYEINIGAEFLNRPSEYTAATMLHEMVHLYCRENDITETCQGGRYHNKLFKQECESRGLIIEYDRANGYSTSLPSESFAETLRANGFILKVPFARHTIEIRDKKTPDREKAHAYVCPKCGQTVRTTQELNIVCGHCNKPMERAE